MEGVHIFYYSNFKYIALFSQIYRKLWKVYSKFTPYLIVGLLQQFLEYSKMIYLDGDIQVFDNIDHLFDLPNGHFYGVMDCFCEKTWSHTPQYKLGYCQQSPEKIKWPVAELGQPPQLYFNAGMFVFEPNYSTYERLLETLKITPPTPFAEQVIIFD